MSDDTRVYFNIAAVFVILSALWYLGAMSRREWVKSDLYARGCQPISVRWFPLAYWAPAVPFFTGPAFKVTYADAMGLVHKAYCWTSNLRPRQVVWVKDQPADWKGDFPGQAEVKPQRGSKAIMAFMLVNAIMAGLVIYGLKCIVTLKGQLLVPHRFATRAFEFSLVEGKAAAFAGLSYMALGVFVYLSANAPRDGRPKLWCFARGVVRWGSFVGMIWLYEKARNV